MSKNPFVVLGVSPDCSQNELFDAYRQLRTKYADLRFADGEVGAEACTKLEEVEQAYNEALEILRNKKSEGEEGAGYFDGSLDDAEYEIKIKNYDKAQEILDNITNRDAQWHYLQSVIFYQKNWLADSLKQLEFACNIDSSNTKYQEARQALSDKINANSANRNSFYQNNNADPNAAASGTQRTYSRYDGTGRRGANVCDCCTSLLCADCCCECMGGDLISCC